MARISKVTKEFNLGLDTIVDFLEKNNFKIERDPNAKITDEMYELLKKEFQPESVKKQEAQEVDLSEKRKNLFRCLLMKNLLLRRRRLLKSRNQNLNVQKL